MLRFCILFLICFDILLLSACAHHTTNDRIPVATFSTRQDVQQFISEVSQEDHFEPTQLKQLFDHVEIKPRVISKIENPIEKTQPWYQYCDHFLNQERIDKGVLFWKKYQQTLHRAEKIYHVPASIIVAIIGVESNYGEKMGEFPVLEALSNIAFNYSERREFFRSELIEFLLLCREKNLNPLSIYGSYAGAIGQPQFMPSSFRKYAVNFSHRGSVDLMHNEIDVIGSVANYFNAYGWEMNKPIVIRAKFDSQKIKGQQKQIDQCLVTESKMDPTLSLSDLKKFGVYPIQPINRKQKVGLIQLEGKKGMEYWIGLNNFFVIKHYNRSPMYAMVVYELSERLKKQFAIPQHHEKK